jgi:hypothetical protein
MSVLEMKMTVEQKKKAAAIGKLNRQLLLTIDVLDADVKFAADQWRKDPSNQFWRRTLVRCLCASTEGALGMLKNIMPESAKFFEVALTPRELEVATERRQTIENGTPRTKRVFLPFSDNLKETLKIFAKIHAVEIAIKYDVSGFKDLCNTFELRNKLMHPKGPFDLGVTDGAVDAAERGTQWFLCSLHGLLNECAKRLPHIKAGLSSH